MKHSSHVHVLVETESGRRFLVQMNDNGMVSCQEELERVKEIEQRSLIVRSTECRTGQHRVKGLMRHLLENRKGASSLTHAEALYSFLNSVPGSIAPAISHTVPFGDDAGIVEQFEREGLVVVTGVLSEGLIDAAVDELWESPRLLGRGSKIRRDDPQSWGSSADWPQQDGGKNFLESLDAHADKACWELAQAPEVVHVMKLLHGRHGAEDILLHEAPRWGVMRPTAVRKEWRTLENWLHWDQNPWTEPGFARVQAFVCLTAQTETSGGLLCAPGYHKRWQDWGRNNPEERFAQLGINTASVGAGSPFQVPGCDPAHQQVVKVLAPKGSLVLWDGRLPHQNFPNTGTDFRMILYLNFSDASAPPGREELELRERRRYLVRRMLGLGGFWPLGLSPLGRSISCTANLPEISDLEHEIGESPELVAAVRLTIEACELEMQGSYTSDPELRERLFHESMRKHMEAEKVYPDIGQWHDVIC
mmetsp:Transcript_138343/g.385887  ORF Transcript_138343/g.385887 Transcript_138343/m.385887 type:complete len:477 (-) Transcript_138343:92-1522(-)